MNTPMTNVLVAARSARPLCAVLALLPVGGLAACENPLHMKPGAKSVLESVEAVTPAEAAEMALDPYDADRRYRGLQLLGTATWAGDPVYVRLFESRLDDTDPGVRGVAVRALGAHGSPEHAARIAGMLGKDADPGVRLECGRALQRLHNPAAVDPLLAAIDRQQEPEATVRAAAARALGQYAQARVVEKLIASLADESLAVNAATASSLRTLTGQDFGYDRTAWQAWYKGTKDLFAARSAYVYEGFHRDRKWWEYLPFIPPPPHEPSAMPAGLDPASFSAAPSK